MNLSFWTNTEQDVCLYQNIEKKLSQNKFGFSYSQIPTFK